MKAQVAQFISRVLPLTVGDGNPGYRLPFISSADPSAELANLARVTQQAYNVNPYIGDPVHVLDTSI